MKQKTLSKWVKCMIILVALCGLAVYIFIIPSCVQSVIYGYPEFGYCYYPWMILIWLTALPCYGVLFLGWKISTNIGENNSFCPENARYLKWISLLAAGDVGFFFIMNIVYLFLNMNHPGIVLASLIIVLIGIAIAVVAAVVSHLVMKAAELQEQADLTV